jgi:hypothetical protein
VGVGWQFIEDIVKSGRKVDPEDLPPALEWEHPIWWLYERVHTQWRVGMSGAVGLDYGPAIALIQSMGWPLPQALTMLQAVEGGFLEAWRAQDGG